MIAKGNTHDSGPKLVAYILAAQEGERVEFGNARGFDFFGNDLLQAAAVMQQMADRTTNCRDAWFHTQTRVAPGEQLTNEQWERVLDREEKRLGFTGHARVWSFHIDEATGEKHLHAGWFRIDPENNRAHDPGLFKLRLMEVARWAEKEFGLRELSNERQPHDKARAPERSEMEESRRLGTDVRAIRTAILDCLEHADGGKAFKAALEEQGLMLANGERRDCFVVVDQEGGQHALNKKLTGQPLAQMRERLTDLDRSQLPTVEQAQEMQRERHAERAQEQEQQPRRYDALGETARQVEAERVFAAAATRTTEPAAPIWDRDAEARAADDRIINAAVRQVAQAPQKSRETADVEKYGRAAEPAQTLPERELSGTAAHIRMAWSMSRAASELEDGLAARGITLAHVSAEEAAASHHLAAFAREIGNFATRLQEGEIVAVDGHGAVYRMNERITGQSQPEIEGRLTGVDRDGLLNVTAAKEAMQQAAREIWKAERAAEREQARPASHIEIRIAECAELAARLGATVFEDAAGQRLDRVEALAERLRPDDERQMTAVTVHGQEALAAQLDNARIGIARVTKTDIEALAALREQDGFDRASDLAHKHRHFAADLVVGDLAAVTHAGDVYRINPDKLGNAKPLFAADLSGVVETRARFEAEREQISELYAERRSEGLAARQDFAAAREDQAQHAQTVRDVHQFNDDMSGVADTGSKATGRLLGGFGKVLSSFISWIADSIAPPPPPTKDQAERLVRVAEERQEQRIIAASEQSIEAQHEIIAEQQRTRDIARTLGIATTGDPEEDRFRSIMQRAARDRDRDYERER